jgi:hypothetical protein
MDTVAPMKAWAIYAKGWGDGPLGITIASTRNRAIARNLASAKDAGYPITWTDFRATRAPIYDHLIAKEGAFSWSIEHYLLKAVATGQSQGEGE